MERYDYGQVYRTAAPQAEGYPRGCGWRGVVWVYSGDPPQGRIAWEDLARATPDSAYDRMAKKAGELGVTDVRRWSGDLEDLPEKGE